MAYAKTYLGQRVKSLSVAPQGISYEGVKINTSDTTYVSAGEIGEGHSVLEFGCPWGTVVMATAVLQSLSTYEYQGYEADGALLDPAAELGDGISFSGFYSGLYSEDISFNRLMEVGITAPFEETIDNEIPFQPNEDRKNTRRFAEVRAELAITASQISARVEEVADDLGEEITAISAELVVQSAQIAAKVSQEGGSAQSFSWELLADHFALKSENSTVFRADEDGVSVTGAITAESGYIGTSAAGFVINANNICNPSGYGYSSTGNGIYIGTNGINLGGNFKVDSAGNLSASSGTFSGNVYASNIQYGSTGGYASAGMIGSGSFNFGGATFGVGGNITATSGDMLIDGTILLGGSASGLHLYKNGSIASKGSVLIDAPSTAVDFSGWAVRGVTAVFG